MIVTGAGSGIGLATARRFGSEGAKVVIADMDVAKAGAAAETVKHAGAPDAWDCACDVSDEAQVMSCVESTIERFGAIDVIVNNAGLMTFEPIIDLTGDDWRRVLGVDLLGTFYFIKEAFKHMRPGGSIVNVVLPGAVDTPMLWDNPNVKSGVEKIDRGDVGMPDDIAAGIAFLASDDARFIQGASLIIDGVRLDRL